MRQLLQKDRAQQPADNHAGACCGALQRTKKQQRMNIHGRRAAQRGCGKNPKADQRQPSSSECIRDGAMPQRHDGEERQEGRHCLLHLGWRNIQALADRRQRRKIGVD